MTTSTKRLVVIVGPTGSGKTDLSIRIALHYGAPILSTDSRQMYRGLPIGTAQPTADQLQAVEHHFIASHDLADNLSCGEYETQALACLERLFAGHDCVVAVGGSGLYVKALCEGMDDLPQADENLRRELAARLRTEGLEALAGQLRTLDPDYYAVVDRSNPAHQSDMRGHPDVTSAGFRQPLAQTLGKAQQGLRRHLAPGPKQTVVPPARQPVQAKFETTGQRRVVRDLSAGTFDGRQRLGRHFAEKGQGQVQGFRLRRAPLEMRNGRHAQTFERLNDRWWRQQGNEKTHSGSSMIKRFAQTLGRVSSQAKRTASRGLRQKLARKANSG